MNAAKYLIIITLCLILLAGMGTLGARAQEQVTVSLETAGTSLQTGQTYDVNIRLDGATDVWVVNTEIRYDTAMLYMMGTQAGSPVTQGPLFAPLEDSIVVRNGFNRPGWVVYTISMLGRAEPVDGGGVIGTFRIYPLAPGEASLSFSRVEVTRLTLVGSGDEVTPVPENLPFTAVKLDFTITGDPVEPPSEATATPTPTEVFSQAGQGGVGPPDQGGGVVNVTAAPGGAGEDEPVSTESAGSGLPTLLIVVLALSAAAGIGALVLFSMSRRRPRVT